MIKTRLDDMVSSESASRSGDIVLVFNIKEWYASVNDNIEEELNGWHGSPTSAESVTPLVYATPGFGWFESDNAGLKKSAASKAEGSYRNSDVRWSIQALIQSLIGE
jgi:hypothetical protein